MIQENVFMPKDSGLNLTRGNRQPNVKKNVLTGSPGPEAEPNKEESFEASLVRISREQQCEQKTGASDQGPDTPEQGTDGSDQGIGEPDEGNTLSGSEDEKSTLEGKLLFNGEQEVLQEESETAPAVFQELLEENEVGEEQLFQFKTHTEIEKSGKDEGRSALNTIIKEMDGGEASDIKEMEGGEASGEQVLPKAGMKNQVDPETGFEAGKQSLPGTGKIQENPPENRVSNQGNGGNNGKEQPDTLFNQKISGLEPENKEYLLKNGSIKEAGRSTSGSETGQGLPEQEAARLAGVSDNGSTFTKVPRKNQGETAGVRSEAGNVQLKQDVQSKQDIDLRQEGESRGQTSINILKGETYEEPESLFRNPVETKNPVKIAGTVHPESVLKGIEEPESQGATQVAGGKQSGPVAPVGNHGKELPQTEKTFQNEIMDQIVKTVSMNLKNGRQEIIVKLKPEFLGRINLQVSTENQQVMIRVVTEISAVKEVIENNINQLRSELGNHGLEIEKFDVLEERRSNQDGQRYGKPRDFRDGTPDGGGDEEGVPLEQIENTDRHSGHMTSSNSINYFA